MIKDRPSSVSKPRLCFILGILQRSGTNYLYSLLREHPSCAGPGPIWEDHFVQHSKMLREYTNTIYRSWNLKWEIDKKIGPQETLLRCFGDAVDRFLKLQLVDHRSDHNASEQGPTGQNSPEILLTKTPSVEGLESFFDLFPDAPLILIIRDGRAVVESGVRSFGWNYEDAMHRWRAGAQAILELKRRHEDSNKKLLIVKYEDIFLDVKSELLRIFGFLGLDPDSFDFDAAQSLGVIGSSEIRKHAGSVHWQATDRTADFNPLARFSNWDRKKHERFNWIAGDDMSRFGYGLDIAGSNRPLAVVRNRFLDAKWTLRTTAARVVRRVRSLLRNSS